MTSLAERCRRSSRDPNRKKDQEYADRLADRGPEITSGLSR